MKQAFTDIAYFSLGSIVLAFLYIMVMYIIDQLKLKKAKKEREKRIADATGPDSVVLKKEVVKKMAQIYLWTYSKTLNKCYLIIQTNSGKIIEVSSIEANPYLQSYINNLK